MSLTTEQQGLRDGILAIARALGLYGSLWTVSSPAGTVRLWLRKFQPTRLELALAGPRAPMARWMTFGEVGAAVSPATVRADALVSGATLTSQEDVTAIFVIRSVETDGGYVRCQVEPAR